MAIKLDRSIQILGRLLSDITHTVRYGALETSLWNKPVLDLSPFSYPILETGWLAQGALETEAAPQATENISALRALNILYQREPLNHRTAFGVCVASSVL